MKMLEDPAPLAPLPKSVRARAAAPVAIALVVGHDPKESGEEGQYKDATGKTLLISEYTYNVIVSGAIRRRLAADDKIVIHDVRRHLAGGYKGMIRHVNSLNADFALELHFNGVDGNPVAGGTEMLHWHTSTVSPRYAEVLQHHHLDKLGLRNRGLKPIRPGGRGALFLRATNCWAVIAEPFFGSNPREMQKAMDNLDLVVEAYVGAICEIAAMIRKGRQR